VDSGKYACCSQPLHIISYGFTNIVFFRIRVVATVASVGLSLLGKNSLTDPLSPLFTIRCQLSGYATGRLTFETVITEKIRHQGFPFSRQPTFSSRTGIQFPVIEFSQLEHNLFSKLSSLYILGVGLRPSNSRTETKICVLSTTSSSPPEKYNYLPNPFTKVIHTVSI